MSTPLAVIRRHQTMSEGQRLPGGQSSEEVFAETTAGADVVAGPEYRIWLDSEPGEEGP